MSTATATPGPSDERPIPLDHPRTEAMQSYLTDKPSYRGTLIGILAAWAGAFVLALAAWLVLKQTSLPAFNTSMVSRAVATAAIVAILLVVGVFCWLWLRDEHRCSEAHRKLLTDASDPAAVAPPAHQRPRWRTWLTYAVCYMAPAGIVVAALAIPLSATTLYLDGIQVDQQFRSQFLTRMADTWANQDMNYWDMPSYYPLGWFWLGGRLAALLGIPGWEVYQPWAIVSISMAGAMLVPIWQRLSGSLPVATGISLVTVCATLVMGADEPYGAVVAMMVPAATVLINRALFGSWWAAAALSIILGVSAAFYTLYTGVVALTVVVIALIFAALTRRFQPVLRLIVVGVGAVLIALVAWGPYLLEVARGAPTSSVAMNYLPEDGTQLPVPFLAPSVLGLLCLAGLVYLVVRAEDWDVRMMGISLLGFYLWALLSMVFTLAGTTLLGFRLDLLIVLQLGTAGVLGLAELRLAGIHRFYPDSLTPRASRRITAIGLIVLMLAGLHYAQQIPGRLQSAIDQAYADTDGYGERADQFPPDTAQYYPAINEEILSHGREANDTVVVTDEHRLLSYHPYHGFNAHTAHYANPLGEFGPRNDQLTEWAERSYTDLSDPQDFAAALDETRWRGPDVFIFRGTLDDDGEGWKTHIAEDIYPSQPNVRYVGILYNPEVFDDESLWHLEEIGPYVVATRNE